ncbi:MAG: hypothetical protein ABSF64_22535 [Bryobacteraceae bacterium]|jgi:hypothetical protein
MIRNRPAIGAPFVLQAAELAQLFPSLDRRGRQVVGPAVGGSAFLKRRDDGAPFGCAAGARGWKRFLYPAEADVVASERSGHGFCILNDTAPARRRTPSGIEASRFELGEPPSGAVLRGVGRAARKSL